MATLIGTFLNRVRRRWRSRLAADAPSWAAGAIIKSMSTTSPGDEGGDHRWQCTRAPALIRVFRRARRPSSPSSIKALLYAATLATALGSIVCDAGATTISVKATAAERKLVCSRTGGEFQRTMYRRNAARFAAPMSASLGGAVNHAPEAALH